MLLVDGGADALQIEAETVRRAADGDADAFAELVGRYQSMVYNLAFHSLRSADDAFDASQDVFLKVYRSLGSFRGDSKFSTWIDPVYILLRQRNQSRMGRRRRDLGCAQPVPASIRWNKQLGEVAVSQACGTDNL